MDSLFAVQLLKKITDHNYDSARSVTPQISQAFVPVPRSNDLVLASSWRGFFFGRFYAWRGSREQEVFRRVRAAWEAAVDKTELDLAFRLRLSQELDPAPRQLSSNTELAMLHELGERAKESYEDNPFPNSFISEFKDSRFEVSREGLEKEFTPVDRDLDAFREYLDRNSKLSKGRDLTDHCGVIQSGLEEYHGWKQQICGTRDKAVRQQAMWDIAADLSLRVANLESDQRWMFCGEYGVRASGFGIARYALKQVSEDKVPEWLKQFLEEGDLPNPQALVEGIVYRVIQQGLDRISKTVGVVFEDLNLDRSSLAEISLPDPQEYVEGLLHRAFDGLRKLSDSLQISPELLSDLHLLFPDQDRSAPDWIGRLLPARMEERVKETIEEYAKAGLIAVLSPLLPAGAIKSLLSLVVRSAYLAEKPESRREWLTDIEQDLAEHIQTSLGMGLDFVDGRLDDLIASAAESLPANLLSWMDLDLIGFGAPCWLEFAASGPDYCEITIYPTGVALNHDWHARDSKTGVVKWPLRLNYVERKNLTTEFLYGLLFHCFEPQCDPQVTLKASEFYNHLSKLGSPFPIGYGQLDRRRNDNGYLIQAMLTNPGEKPEKIENDRHFYAIMGLCSTLWDEKQRTIIIEEAETAETLSKAATQWHSEAKKLFKKQEITAYDYARVVETKREIEAAVKKCRQRLKTSPDLLEKVRVKLHNLEQNGVSSLQEAKEWLSWALGDEVGTLIEAVAGAIPPVTSSSPPKENAKGWLRDMLQQLGGWAAVSALSHCLTVLESLRSRAAPLYAAKLVHRTLDRLAPKIVTDWYHTVLRIITQKLSDLVVFLVLESLSSRMDLTRVKLFAEAGKSLVARLTQEVKSERTISLECKPALFEHLPSFQLKAPTPLKHPSEQTLMGEVGSLQPQLTSFYAHPVTDAITLHSLIAQWIEEDKRTMGGAGMKPFLYQRTLQRIRALPLPYRTVDPVWGQVDDLNVLYFISDLGRLLHDTHTETILGEDEYIIAHYHLLFIIEKLIDRLYPEALRGWSVNAYNFLRYAKGAMTGFSPELEKRFFHLFHYRFPDLNFANLPSEEMIKKLANDSLFARQGSQPTALSRYISWYEKQVIGPRETLSDRQQKWYSSSWVQYLKKQVNDTYTEGIGLPLPFRLLRMQSLFAHFAVSGTEWAPQHIGKDWHEKITQEADQESRALARIWSLVAKSKENTQPETEAPQFAPEFGRSTRWLDSSVLRLQTARQTESKILSEGPSTRFDPKIPRAVVLEFEAIFCEERNQLQRALVFLEKRPEGVWPDNPYELTKFLYAMLFQTGKLQRELHASKELPHLIHKVLQGLFSHYLKTSPSACIPLAYIAILAKPDLDLAQWLKQLYQLGRPQFRDAAYRLKALLSCNQKPTDQELLHLCSGLLQEAEPEADPAFELLEQLISERYILWQPTLLARLEDRNFQKNLIVAAMNRMGIQMEKPEEILCNRDSPLILSWPGHQLDLARRTLSSQLPLYQLVELAKERGRYFGIPVDSLTEINQTTYESESGTFRMEITELNTVLFYRKHENGWYRHIEAKDLPGGDIGRHLGDGILWLEETPTNQKRLMVGKHPDTEIWSVYLSEQGTTLRIQAQISPQQRFPIGIEQWLPSLSPLAGFCSLNKVNCYTDEEGMAIRQIVIDLGLSPLIFDGKEADGQLRAYGTGEHAGFWIALEQNHPPLDGLGGYLLLENSHSKRVLLAGSQWVTAGIWRGIEKLQVAPFLRRWMTDMAIQSQPHISSAPHVFDLVNGSLVSDDPKSHIYLLLLYMGLGRTELAEQISRRLERLFCETDKPLSQEVIDGLFPLALILPKVDKQAMRIRRKLFAALELHLARFQREKVNPSGSIVLNKIYYLLLISSTFSDLQSIAKTNNRLHQVTEEQEYLLYQRLFRLVKELHVIRGGQASESLMERAIEIFKGILSSSGKGPELFQRYQTLRHTFEIHDSMTSWLAEKGAKIYEAPATHMENININLGKQVFNPTEVTKRAIVKVAEEAMQSRSAELDYTLLARMNSEAQTDAPSTFSGFKADSHKFISYFFTYYTWAYYGNKRLKGVIQEGGMGDPTTRNLMAYLQKISSIVKLGSLSWVGRVPTPKQLQQALQNQESESGNIILNDGQLSSKKMLSDYFLNV